jgi:hypothetical protein
MGDEKTAALVSRVLIGAVFCLKGATGPVTSELMQGALPQSL